MMKTAFVIKVVLHAGHSDFTATAVSFKNYELNLIFSK